MDSGKHLVIPCLCFLLYWSRFSCAVSGENLFNYTNLLYSGFVLVGLWFFSDKGVFHVNPCVIYFSDFIFFVLVDILPRLISGCFSKRVVSEPVVPL